MEQGSLKWSEMKSFMPGISHLLQKTDFKLIATLLRKSQNTISVSKQASKLISKKRDIPRNQNPIDGRYMYYAKIFHV